jgi:hypothetical protein
MTRIHKIIVTSIYLLLIFSLYAENVNTYDAIKKQFVMSSLSEKNKLITDISVNDQSISTIFIDSLEFVTTNYALLSDEPDFVKLASTSTLKCISTDGKKALQLLEELFVITDKEEIKRSILTSFAVLGKNSENVSNLVNEFVSSILKNNPKTQLPLLGTCLNTVSVLNNIVFFDTLFECYVYVEDETIRQQAKIALEDLSEDYEKQILSVLKNGTIIEKRKALQLVLDSTKKSDFFKAEISEKALSNAIYTVSDVSSVDSEMIALQLQAVRELDKIQWTRSSPLLVDFFILAKQEFNFGLFTEDEFVEIISAFTRLASLEAGNFLSTYLGELNKKFEETGSYSSPVVAAVIKNLGGLGNKVAFDNLLYTTYLDYSDVIVTAARDSLARLKW